ncbi:MAG: hypothetical protein AB1705_16530 [Verrucomicrobiota bacterium]
MSDSVPTAEEDVKLALRVKRFVLLGVILVPIVAFILWRLALSSGNDKLLKAIRDAGEPANAVELDAYYKQVPAEKNAASYWIQGADEMIPPEGANLDAPWYRFKLPPRGQSFTNDLLAEARESLVSNQAALAAFRRAAEMTDSRYPIDLSQATLTLLPHLTRVKQVANLLRMESAIQAHDGNSRESVRAILNMLAAGQSLENEPVLISQLVRYAVDSMAFQCAEFLLNRAHPNDQELLTLTKAFEAVDDPRSLSLALIGERAFFVSVLDNPRLLALTSANGATPTPSENFTASAVSFTGFYQRERGFYLPEMATNIALARLPDPQRFLSHTNWDAGEARAKAGFYFLSGLTLSSVGRSVHRDAEHRAQARVALAAFSVERYRLKHNDYPKDLASLVPEFLPAVPIDPFDGKPLRFQLRAHGYIVYSIGTDAKDDGGAERPERRGTAKVPEDITFIVDRPARLDLTK